VTDAATMRRLLDGIYLAAGGLAALFVLAIVVLMVAQSVLRGLGVATGAVNDVVAWFCAAAAFLAMPHAFKHGDFVRVTLLLERLSAPARRGFELAALAIGAVAVGYLCWSALQYTFESWQFNDIAQGLMPIPLWLPQLSFALGSVLLLVAVLDELVVVLRGGRPSYVVAVEERHAHGDFSSDV
jgi:TRAP-type C4-dicarboxylate transport system permease small subunit